MCVNFQFHLFFFQNITYDALMQAIKKVNENSLMEHKCQKSKMGNGKADFTGGDGGDVTAVQFQSLMKEQRSTVKTRLHSSDVHKQ